MNSETLNLNTKNTKEEEKNIKEEEEPDEPYYVQYCDDYSVGCISSFVEMKTRLETPIEKEFRINREIKKFEKDTDKHRVQYITKKEYDTPGCITNFIKTKLRLETNEEQENRREKEKRTLYKQYKKTNFNNGNYIIKGFKETYWELVRCAIEEYDIVDRILDNGTIIKQYKWTELIEPENPAYWEYATKKELIEGYDLDGNKIIYRNK
jgi:hypothetical protein